MLLTASALALWGHVRGAGSPASMQVPMAARVRALAV